MQQGSDRSQASAIDFCRQLVRDANNDYRSMHRHPFIELVREGKATRDQLIAFGNGQYRLVVDAQRWTASGFAQIADPFLRVKLLGSMYEEETGGDTGTASHAELVADFLEALGQPRPVTYEVTKRLPGPWQCLADYSEFLGRCRPYWLYRGTVSLAGEAQFIEVCKTMVRALVEHYGISGPGLTFWEIHIPADEEHTANAIDVIQTALEDPTARVSLRESVFTYMDLRYSAWLSHMGEVTASLVSASA